jgi:hypothetical protein
MSLGMKLPYFYANSFTRLFLPQSNPASRSAEYTGPNFPGHIKPMHLTTATSPFLGHRKALSLFQILQIARQSLLIQSPGKEKISLIVFSELTLARWGLLFLRLALCFKPVVSGLLDLVAGFEDMRSPVPDGILQEQIEELVDKKISRL